MAIFTEFERDQNADYGVMWHDFVSAVGIWVYTNELSEARPTIGAIACAFNTTPEIAREAVDDHAWLFRHKGESAEREFVESDGDF